MYKIITDDVPRICAFVSEIQGATDWNQCTAIGLEKDGKLLAGVIYDYYNGVNVCMHIAALEGKRWATKSFLHMMFWYPFEQLGCSRMTGFIPENGNPAARNFAEQLKGIELEGRMADAHPLGDMLIFCMKKENCTYLRIKDGKS